jgi:hypothetical protein
MGEIPAMYGTTQCLEDALEQLKSQRQHLANSTRVLEAIICHCSDIARSVAAMSIRELATRFRDTAITVYASSRTNASAIRDLLEQTISGLEQELKAKYDSQEERNAKRPVSP